MFEIELGDSFAVLCQNLQSDLGMKISVELSWLKTSGRAQDFIHVSSGNVFKAASSNTQIVESTLGNIQNPNNVVLSNLC